MHHPAQRLSLGQLVEGFSLKLKPEDNHVDDSLILREGARDSPDSKGYGHVMSRRHQLRGRVVWSSTKKARSTNPG